jgi:hypothetical protein
MRPIHQLDKHQLPTRMHLTYTKKGDRFAHLGVQIGDTLLRCAGLFSTENEIKFTA